MWSLFVSLSLMVTLFSVQAMIMEEEASPYHYGNYVESLVSFWNSILELTEFRLIWTIVRVCMSM